MNNQTDEENIEKKLRKCRGCKDYKLIILGKTKCDICSLLRTCKGECGETKSINDFYSKDSLCKKCKSKFKRKKYREDSEERIKSKKRSNELNFKIKNGDHIRKKRSGPSKKMPEDYTPHNKVSSLKKDDGFEYRICPGCCEEKKICDDNFYATEVRCKICISESGKKYREENKENVLKNRKEKRKKNKEERGEEISKQRAEYYSKNKEKNRKKNSEAVRNRRKNNPSIKLRNNVSRMIHRILNLSGSSKNGISSWKKLGYTPDELKAHLFSLFEPWMTWENWGKYIKNKWDDNDQTTWTWQLDHIIPQSDLPYTNMDDENFKKSWALSNLRPLRSDINLLEGVRRVRHKKDIK